MSKFMITIYGYGGEYASMKAKYEDLHDLVKLYDEDNIAFIDKIDEAENHFHETGVFDEDIDIEVKNIETGEIIDSSDWCDGDFENLDGLLDIQEDEYCICSISYEKGLFFMFEVEDDKFHFEKLYRKEIETWFGDMIVGFGYGNIEDENYIGDEAYDTTGKGMRCAVIGFEDGEEKDLIDNFK